MAYKTYVLSTSESSEFTKIFSEALDKGWTVQHTSIDYFEKTRWWSAIFTKYFPNETDIKEGKRSIDLEAIKDDTDKS